MTGLRATPQRGSYRVYTEDEFFASEGPPASAGTPAVPGRVLCAAPPARGRRALVGARVVWCALLSVVAAAVTGVVALDAVRSRAGGRLLADGGVVPHPPRAARSAPVAARASSGGAVRRRPARRAPSTFSRAARRQALAALAPPARPRVSRAAGVVATPATASAASPTTSVASSATPVAPAPTPPTASPATPAASSTTPAAPAPAPPAATATAAATAATAHGARAEFGFER